MKKIVFLLFVLVAIGTIKAQTNKYYNANENWMQTSVGMTMGQPWGIFPRYFWVNGDTVLNGKTFKQLFYIEKAGGTTFVQTAGSNSVPSFLVSEENDTITILTLCSPDSIVDTTRISYNFTTMNMWTRHHYTDYTPDYIQEGSGSIYYIQDTIVINGVPRRIFNTSAGMSYEGAFWAYSGGMVVTITDPMQLDGYNELQCYGGNDSVYVDYSGEIFPGNPYVLNPPVPGNCNIDSIYWSSIDELSYEDLYLFPNPCEDEVHVNIHENVQISLTGIYNMLGEKIDMVILNTHTIETKNLPAGVYVLEINAGKRVLYRRFCKR